MVSCNGCGEALGFKKYKFNKMFRIGGRYFKPCMMKVGENWEKFGRITFPMAPCDLCKTEFYFLKPKASPQPLHETIIKNRLSSL